MLTNKFDCIKDLDIFIFHFLAKRCIGKDNLHGCVSDYIRSLGLRGSWGSGSNSTCINGIQ